jgi:hypothetical protein
LLYVERVHDDREAKGDEQAVNENAEGQSDRKELIGHASQDCPECDDTEPDTKDA